MDGANAVSLSFKLGTPYIVPPSGNSLPYRSNLLSSRKRELDTLLEIHKAMHVCPLTPMFLGLALN